MHLEDIALFALGATRNFGEGVAASLGVPLSQHEERDFDDGEHKARPLASVRGRDVFVIQSLYGGPEQSVNDKLCRMLFFIGALRDASAGRITAVAPYLCYARKDQRTKSRDPVSTRYVAQMFEAQGADGLLTMDVHNPAAVQNAWRVPVDHLRSPNLLLDGLSPFLDEEIAVVSPDIGGVKRAEDFRQAVETLVGRPASQVFLEKRRSAGEVTGGAVIGNLASKTVIIVDDIVASGTTLARAAEACRAEGAARVFAAAAHGVFSGGAARVLENPAIEKLAVTNTVPPFRLPEALIEDKLIVRDAAPLFAEAIRRIHEGGSLVELLG